MRVLMAPMISASLNPYQHLLQRGIEQSDPGIKCTGWSGLSLRWLVEQRSEIDILHLHWVEHLYLSPTAYRTYRRFFVTVLALIAAKALGKPVVYTVHNLTQHGKAFPVLNRLAARLVFRLADVVHVHDQAGRDGVAAKYGRKQRVTVIPHSSYLGYYPDDLSPLEARKRLEIPTGSFVYLCFGQMRSNKGLEGLLGAFAEMKSPSARLILAGWAPDKGYGEKIRDLSARDPRVTVHLRFVAEDEVQSYLNACDVCVLPYETVTTSGAALLAFSFGKPVIAPRMGCFPELIGESRGVLYDPRQPGGLREALENAQRSDHEAAGGAAITLARQLDWITIGGRHAKVYRGLIPGSLRECQAARS